MAKATLATVKKFIRINRGKLLISCKSDFDGMVDCVMPCKDKSFSPALNVADGSYHENNMGIQGAWFVFGSRDYITPYTANGMTGYDIYNCCGNFVLAVKE